jgi:hypothetical protein
MRRKRMVWLIAALGVLVVVIVLATLLPFTKWLPAPFRVVSPPPFLAARDRNARWQQDLGFLAKELPRLHVNAFHTTSKNDFEMRVAELDTAIPTLTDHQVVLRLMELVAQVGDGHTSLNFTSFYQGEEPWRLYPLSVAWLEGAWYVMGAEEANAQLLGAQLVAIDNVPVDEVFGRIAPLLAADNDMQRVNTGGTLMVTAEVLTALGITEGEANATFSLRLVDGTQIEIVLLAVAPAMLQLQSLQSLLPPGELPLAQRNPERWYWFETLPEANALYFQYDVCAEMQDLPFADFTRSLFETVDSEGLDRIVIDLRNNGGGNSAVLHPFLEGLAERPDLDVFVLIGRRTFSSALMNAIELDQEANATLVGEPTGGRPNHYGEVRSFALPNSQLKISYSTKFFRELPDSDPPSLQPEIAAPPTLANQLAGHDAALAAALAQ